MMLFDDLRNERRTSVSVMERSDIRHTQDTARITRTAFPDARYRSLAFQIRTRSGNAEPVRYRLITTFGSSRAYV